MYAIIRMESDVDTTTIWTCSSNILLRLDMSKRSLLEETFRVSYLTGELSVGTIPE